VSAPDHHAGQSAVDGRKTLPTNITGWIIGTSHDCNSIQFTATPAIMNSLYKRFIYKSPE